MTRETASVSVCHIPEKKYASDCCVNKAHFIFLSLASSPDRLIRNSSLCFDKAGKRVLMCFYDFWFSLLLVFSY